MSSWQSLHYLNLLWLLFPLLGLFIAARWRRQTMLRRLAHPSQRQRLAQSANPTARAIRATLFIMALAAIILALARPSWNKSRQPFKAKGRDVVFILDISRSMLAAHRNTTRLEEAKFAIQECLSTVRGDRVALIIFAGNAKVACPLTHDYAYFLAKLDDVDYRSVTFGGTMLGDAVRLACSSIFKTRAQLYRDVIVITDGEDMESNPVQAAEQLADLNARLIVVGMGDSTPTPLVITTPDGRTETITDNGSPVMTKLDIDTLRKMTDATPGGVLIPVPSDTMLNLNDIYSKYIDMQVKKDFETHSVVTYEEKYQLFLAIAMILLTILHLIPERRKLTSATLAIALLTASPTLPAAEDVTPKEISALIDQAQQQMEAKDIEAARTALKKALELQPDNPLANFNLAALDYIQENYKEALNGFQRALSLAQSQNFDIPGFKEKAHLGIAASSYRLSQKEDNQNPQPDAELAVRHFKDALDCNPQNDSTRDNLNSAKLNYKAIRQRLKQQQQQQQNGGQNDKDNKKDNQNDEQKDNSQQKSGSQNADEQKQNQDGQNGDSQDNDLKQSLQNLEKQQRQASEDMKNNGKSQEDLQKQQHDLQKQAQDALDRQRQNSQDSSQSPQSKKAEDFMKESLAKQQEAKEHLDKNDRQQAQQAQKDAADLTSMARQSLDQQEPPQQKQPDEQPQEKSAQPQDVQKPQQEQPKQTDVRAMDAINQENINRLNRQRKAFNAPAIQNKDW